MYTRSDNCLRAKHSNALSNESAGANFKHMYTETKKFSNTLQIRIFITEIHVEITQTE